MDVSLVQPFPAAAGQSEPNTEANGTTTAEADTASATTAAAAGQAGDLDAMAKGKGKDWRCHGCDGKGHVVANCPSKPGVCYKV